MHTSPAALHGALNLWNCTKHLTRAQLIRNREHLARHGASAAAAKDVVVAEYDVGATIFVSSTGSDSAAGTEAAPLKTLGAAAKKVASTGGAGGKVVVVREGKYFVSETLALTNAHSHSSWTAYPGEEVTLSGAAPLTLAWETYKDDIMMAKVTLPSALSDAEQTHYHGSSSSSSSNSDANSSSSSNFDFGPPPAKLNQLFVDGVRQVRARYPNGNPQDTSGICFSSTNRHVINLYCYITENLLENTDGVPPLKHPIIVLSMRQLAGPLHLLTCVLLVTSSHSEDLARVARVTWLRTVVTTGTCLPRLLPQRLRSRR